MSPKQTTALRLDTELLTAMRRVKTTIGIPLTTQIEMAVREWLKQWDEPKAGRKQPASRKRR